jgi:hypothetical protein
MKLHLLIAAAAVISLSACAAGTPEPASGSTQAEASEPASSTASAESEISIASQAPASTPATDTATEVACDPVEQPPLQAGEHLIGDQEPPVPYNSTPPTSGWHASGAFTIDVRPPDDPLSEPKQVSVLEVGGVVVTYQDLPDEDRARLEEHVRDNHADRVAVTPYDQLEPGEVAFTAWGNLQRCSGLDLSALDAFVAEHADEEVHVPGAH